MSDLFENIELQMQADAKEKNPRSAILASQMETEKRFGKFIDENSDRVSIIEKEIRNVTDKYAYQYDVDPAMVYQATVSYLTKSAMMEQDLEEPMEGILPGIRESLDLMVENGFNQLAESWEERLSKMAPSSQVEFYPEVVDSFVEAVQNSPHTEMWEMDPNQYEEWDKTSSNDDLDEMFSGMHAVSALEDSYYQLDEIARRGYEDSTPLDAIPDFDAPEPFEGVSTIGEYKQYLQTIIEKALEDYQRAGVRVPTLEDIQNRKRTSSAHKNLSDEEQELMRRLEAQLSELEGKEDDEPYWANPFWPSATHGEVKSEIENKLNDLKRRTSSKHRNLSDEELLNRIKEEVDKIKKIDEPVSETLEELHQELWDRSGHGDKWKNRKNKTEQGEEKTAAGNYVAYQIKGNDHFLCPHCAQEMTGEDLNWEDSLSPISNNEMSDIAKYTGHSGKCDQCGEYLNKYEKNSSFLSMADGGNEYQDSDRNYELENRLIDIANEAGHSRLIDKMIARGPEPITSEDISNLARQLWEVLKGDRRPEVRSVYNLYKDELVKLMTEANRLAYKNNSDRMSKREAAVAKFIGIENQFIQKEAMNIYGGPMWDALKKRWMNAPGYDQPLFQFSEDNLEYQVPAKKLNEETGEWEVPKSTWHDYIMRSNLFGNKGYPLKNPNQIETEQGLNPIVNVNDDDDTQEIPNPNVNPQQATDIGDILNNKRRRKRNNPFDDWVQSSFTPIEEKLLEVYMNKGLNEKYASIIVESVGEMAQLQMDAPGLPVADSECETIDPDKSIGGEEGNKYQNWNVADKQKDLDAEHQDFTDFGEPVREFVQPGGEAPYTENTKKKIDQGAESVKMDAKKVKQDDNAPKKSY